MAQSSVAKLSSAGVGFSELPVTKQLLILVVISASIAIGVMVALWTRQPNMIPLYAHLDPAENYQVLEALQKTNIPHKFDPSGGVLVTVDKVHEVRMQLAARGLPKSNSYGYELLDKPAGFATSDFMENLRYRRSLEGELTKTIVSLNAIRAARVHLGLPKQSSFIKRQTLATASVMLDLYSGQQLDVNQISGIVHLIASSVAGLQHKDVTVIDQNGHLLSARGSNQPLSMAIEEDKFVSQKEQAYARKIEELLQPIYGQNGVRAEVSAVYDFTFIEKTAESFDRDKTIVRSEALVAEQKTSGENAEGIPGSLTNQPPGLPEPGLFDEQEGGTTIKKAPLPTNYRSQAKREFEVDKTITHQRNTVGELKRLSVAVVIDDKVARYIEGKPVREKLTEDELAQIADLVKDAIGFDENRGDSVRIVNSAFAVTADIIDNAPSLLTNPGELVKQSWFIPLVKQIIGGIFMLLLVFNVLKPMLIFLIKSREVEQVKPEPEPEPEVPKIHRRPQDMATEARVEHARQLAHDDSRKAAQVVMNWVGGEDD